MRGIISPCQESKNGSRTHVLTDKILKETSSMKKKAKSPSQKRRDQPSSSPLRTTIPWTNHRPPSMTDIPELDCGPVPQFGSVRGTLNIEPNPFIQKIGILKLTGKDTNLTSAPTLTPTTTPAPTPTPIPSRPQPRHPPRPRP